MHVDFAKVREIPVEQVLAHYNVETRKRSNTQLVANCPFASHKDSTHKQWTLAISLDKNRWYCHSITCRAASNKPKGGDAIDVCAMLENLTPLDAAKKLTEVFCIGSGQSLPPSKPLPTPSENKPLAFQLKGITPEHAFIQDRGIAPETAREFGVGFFPGKGSMANRIVFPLYENGVLIGYAGRTLGEVTDDNPKWKLPLGLVKTSFLYGIERCDPSKPLILVESSWGVLFFFERDRQAVALMGHDLNEAQEALLEPFKEIIIAMDNDDVGRQAAAKIAERLRTKHKVYKAHLIG